MYDVADVVTVKARAPVVGVVEALPTPVQFVGAFKVPEPVHSEFFSRFASAKVTDPLELM
jgi:hypothetical protein